MFAAPLRGLKLAVILLFVAIAMPAVAQQGPPPEVRKAISDLLKFTNSQGDAAVEAFVVTSLDPDWVAAIGARQARATLREIRSAAAGLGGEVDVSRVPDGLVLKLTGPGRVQRIAMAVSPAGIGYLRLLQDVGDGGGGDASRGAAMNDHLMTLERLGLRPLDEALAEFEAQRFSEQFMTETSHEERRALLASIRDVAAGAGAVMLGAEGDLMRLKMRGPKSLSVLVGVEMSSPFRISLLRTEAVDAGEQKLELSWDNVVAYFDNQSAADFSGVVHLRRSNDVVLHKSYGLAYKSPGVDGRNDSRIENRIDTVFGIGSTPIDFTVAGVLLLAQQEKLSLEDPVSRHFPDVPADKRELTIRHLISGQSGLPDFHDIESDWDADLAWVDRETAVKRILSQPLLFVPGESRAHSHSAYGLVAAIIEQVSDQRYYDFMQENFFRPAGMTRTGMYGMTGGLELEDFAEGYGNSSVGLPNIPPNWGPTSWLVMGSGGMYSTLDDMLKFYRFVRGDGVLDARNSNRFRGQTVGVGGSDRGFYFLHAYDEGAGEIVMMMNGEGRTEKVRALSRALENLLFEDSGA